MVVSTNDPGVRQHDAAGSHAEVAGVVGVGTPYALEEAT